MRIRTCLTRKLRQQISIRKTIRPEIGSVYHITVRGCPQPLVLLGLARLANATPAIPPALYHVKDQLRADDMRAFWQSLNEQCRSLTIV